MDPFESQTNPFALSTGDLMAALLLMFVLLLSATLLVIKENEEETRSIVRAYEALQNELYQDLLIEFDQDLERWAADLDRETLAIRFYEPQVLFEQEMQRYVQFLPKYWPIFSAIHRNFAAGSISHTHRGNSHRRTHVF